MDMQSLAELTDADLLMRVKGLVQNERRATVVLIAHLAEIDNRKLYLGEACGSLFTYSTRVLHLSEHAAYNRIEAARTARRFPAVLASLEQGLVHLAAVRLLAPVLTLENHAELLASAKHQSKREVEELVARLRPQPDVPAQVRKLPAVKPSSSSSPSSSSPSPCEPPASALNASAAHQPEEKPEAPAEPKAANAPAAPRAVVAPLAPERYKVQFTASAATREKLRRAQELLRHRIPTGDVGEVVDLALDLLVRELEKKKFAATDRPRLAERGAGVLRRGDVALPGSPLASLPPSLRSSRHITAEVKRAVWERDQGRCAFVGANGERCTERGALEFDHIRPHADGGGATVDKVRLLCRRHNQYEAQQFFGPWQEDGARMTAPR